MSDIQARALEAFRIEAEAAELGQVDCKAMLFDLSHQIGFMAQWPDVRHAVRCVGGQDQAHKWTDDQMRRCAREAVWLLKDWRAQHV